MGHPHRALSRASTLCAVLLLPSLFAAGQGFSVVHSFPTGLGNPWAAVTEGPGGALYGTAETGGLYGLGSVFVLTPDGSGGFTPATLYSFTGGEDGEHPRTRLLLASDGKLYGTTSEGGEFFRGTIYRIGLDGALTTLHAFTFEDGPGAGPLTEGPGPEFYGTSQDGLSNFGRVFRVDGNGTFEVLHDLAGGDEGAFAFGALAFGGDGALYGTAVQGGAGGGVVYRVDAVGSYTIFHDFIAADGGPPSNGLIRASDGNLYGMTQFGGQNDLGTIYRLESGGDLFVIHDLADGEGRVPLAELLDPGDGYLYGTNTVDTDANTGTVFRTTLAGALTVLHHLVDADDGPPLGGVIRASDGKIYGTAHGNPFSTGLGNVYRLNPDGTAFEVIYGFSNLEGTQPNAGFFRGADGMFYGTCGFGGTSGDGTVYRMDSDGHVTLLHDFAGTDGSGPGVLVDGEGGVFYGSTFAGGPGGFPKGVVFRIDGLGGFSILHGFVSSEGSGPSGLRYAADGGLTGTTYYGGPGPGTVFHIDALGVFSKIHDFVPEEGGGPTGNLTGSDDAHLFGTTYAGSLYRIDAVGPFTLLRTFTGLEGANPVKLLAGLDGDLYGITDSNTFFRASADGRARLLHTFTAGEAFVPSGLLLGADGNFYAVSRLGGGGQGSLLRVDPSGTAVLLHAFTGADGSDLMGGLAQSPDGDLWGTASVGGAFGGGTVFRFTPPAALSVWGLTPTSGPADGGTEVTIAGLGFEPGAGVTFGVVPASGSVESGQQIVVTAPALEPGTLNDVTVLNPSAVGGGSTRAWLADFADTPQADPFHGYVESLFRALVTAGCGNGNYCGAAPVSRAQMAVFLLKAKLGNAYVPPPATGTRFVDVPIGSFAADWIEDLAGRGITAGCGDGTRYCPDDPVSRAEMAVFLLKTLLGLAYAPPPATGKIFDDVAADSFAADWIEDLFARGITGGCSEAPPLFCPDAPNTRGQMAVFLTLTFRLL